MQDSTVVAADSLLVCKNCCRPWNRVDWFDRLNSSFGVVEILEYAWVQIVVAAIVPGDDVAVDRRVAEALMAFVRDVCNVLYEIVAVVVVASVQPSIGSVSRTVIEEKLILK